MKSKQKVNLPILLALLFLFLVSLPVFAEAATPPPANFSDPASREQFERSLSPDNFRSLGDIVGLERPAGTEKQPALDFLSPVLPSYAPATITYMPTAAPYPLGSVPLSSGFDYPVGGLNHEGFDIITCFGCNVEWLGDYGHTAEDFANGREGDPVFSVSEGTVLWRGVGPNAYGNVVIVQHNVQGATFFSLYAHLQSINVSPGQVVGRRQQIATVGQSGTFLPHLHFEVRTQPYIAPRGYTFTRFSGNSVDYYGMTFYAPSWFIENYRHLDSPFGTINGTQVIPGGFKAWGWAIDPNTASPITVHAYMDGQGIAVAQADGARPDIGANFPAYGSQHGYSAAVPASPGVHTICTFGINVGAGANTELGCLNFQLTGNPFGYLENVALGADKQLHASGWSIDPDTAAPINVRFYINGQYAGETSAAGARGELASAGAYPEYGANHGYDASLPKFAGINDVCAYAVNVNAGNDTLLGCKAVHAGLEDFPLAPAGAGLHYYWPWFDGVGGSDWLLMADTSDLSSRSFDLNMAGRSLNLGLLGNPVVNPKQSFFINYRGIAGGPVTITSLSGEPAVVSQRVLWAGNSLEEIPGSDEGKLSDHFYWPWYDQQTPGMANWVMLANPGNTPVYYEVRTGGRDPGPGSSGTVNAGAIAYPAFPGNMGGPLEVRAWTDETKSSAALLMASQRTLSGFGKAFNEVTGTPATELSDHYLWTWYDAAGSAGRDWIMLGNPGGSPLYYEVKIGGSDPGPGSSGILQPGGFAYPVFPGKVGGPVEVQAWDDENKTAPAGLIASQRVLWGPSFEEVPGFPVSWLKSSYAWTWYDMQSPGSANWVMISNPGDTEVTYQIRIGGQSQPQGPSNPGIIPAHGKVTPTFAGVMNGPVEVSASGNIIASQRVVWHGYFNEVLGTG